MPFHRRDHELARIAPRRVLEIGLPLTPPTLFPRLGRVLDWALQAPLVGKPAGSFERADAFGAREIVPGADVPSALAWLGLHGA
jgi:hypothetical protein